MEEMSNVNLKQENVRLGGFKKNRVVLDILSGYFQLKIGSGVPNAASLL
jgi:hypothetical protein